MNHVEKHTNITLGGAFSNPTDEALIIFEAQDRQEVENFAVSDPYVKNGLVTDYTIRGESSYYEILCTNINPPFNFF